MTNEEAIKILESTNIVIGRGTGRSIPPVYLAIAKAVEALEKQIPKVPIHKRISASTEIIFYDCPNCGSQLDPRQNNCCNHCGQVIDWI